MAHEIYIRPAERPCPRCGSKTVRIATYYFGASYTVECAHCGFGRATGDDEAMARARYHGKVLEAGQPKREEGADE